MNDTNLALLEKNRDILSIRDLATGTIATYTSYLTDYINWVEENLPGRSLSDVTWEEIRSYEKYLKDVRKLNPRTINVFISQLRDFYNYVLHKDYRDGGKTKTMTVSGMEFIRRFLKHVLPSHFNRIRYSGYLTNCRKTFCLKLIHMLRSTVYPGNPYRTMNNAQLMMALYHKDVCKCGKCGGKTIVLCRGKPQSGLLLYSELLEKFEQSSAE